MLWFDQKVLGQLCDMTLLEIHLMFGKKWEPTFGFSALNPVFGGVIENQKITKLCTQVDLQPTMGHHSFPFRNIILLLLILNYFKFQNSWLNHF